MTKHFPGTDFLADQVCELREDAATAEKVLA
jgi:hypothetical protein